MLSAYTAGSAAVNGVEERAGSIRGTGWTRTSRSSTPTSPRSTRPTSAALRFARPGSAVSSSTTPEAAHAALTVIAFARPRRWRRNPRRRRFGPWQRLRTRFPGEGVHHLALVTSDMDATVRFWHGVIGARLVTTLATPSFRHYFFEVAPGNTIAFFDYAGQRLATYPSRPACRTSSVAVRPSVDAAARRGCAAAASCPPEEPRLRGHRRRRPRLPSLDLLQRQQRHCARGVLVAGRIPPAARRTTVTSGCSPTSTPCPRSVS